MPANFEIAATVFGGLGLFFFALQFLSQNLKLLAGSGLRRHIARMTGNVTSAMAVGTVMITLTQSGAASVFLLVGLVRAGLLTLRQAQPVILGISIGAAFTVLFLTLDIRVAVMLLIGTSGITYAYGRASAARVASAAIGIALLLLGLQIMRDGSTALETQAWFQQAVEFTQGKPELSFAIAALLSILVQSSIAVTVVMIAFQRAGLFEQAEAIMFVYGANVGSSVLTYILSSGLTGAARQVALYLVGFNFVAALIMVPLFYVELGLDIPLIAAAVSAISADPGTQAALVYVAFNLAPIPVLLILLDQTARLLKRIAPETDVELLTKPKYLDTELPNEAGIAFRLIELEQARLIQPLIATLDAMREGRSAKALEGSLEAFDSLADTISTAVDTVTSSTDLSSDAYHQLDEILRIQANLLSARQALSGLAVEISHLRRTTPDLSFTESVVEGLDVVMHVLADVADSREPEDCEMLSIMTSDQGNGIRSVRSAYLSGEDAIVADDRIHLLAATNYAERLIWLTGEMGSGYNALGPN